MIYVIIICCIAAIFLIATDGLKGAAGNKTGKDKLSQFENRNARDEGTHLGKSHTFLPWFFKSRHK